MYVILYLQKYILVSCKLVFCEAAYSSLEIEEEPYKHSLDAMMDCFDQEGEYIPEKVKSLSETFDSSEIIGTLTTFITRYETDILGIPSLQVSFPLFFLFQDKSKSKPEFGSGSGSESRSRSGSGSGSAYESESGTETDPEPDEAFSSEDTESSDSYAPLLRSHARRLNEPHDSAQEVGFLPFSER